MNRFEAYKQLSEGIDVIGENIRSPHEQALELALSATPFILYGPPGTGKSRTVQLVIESLEKTQKLGRLETIQFHRKFSYEDFIEGYKPHASGFIPKEGVFKKFCREVSDPYVLDVFVIDEINRADLASTFGEALYALEDRESRTVTTAHLQETFKIPSNVLIIGTMNTADRSIANVDFAVRRRFKFVPVFPLASELRNWLTNFDWLVDDFSIDDYCNFATRLNARISAHPMLGYHMQLGNSMFVPGGASQELSFKSLEDNFNQVVLPQLEAYVGLGNRDGISQLTSPLIAEQFVAYRTVTREALAGYVRESSTDKSPKSEHD